MTTSTQENQAQNQEAKQNDKEYNFRQLEAKYQRELAAANARAAEAEKLALETRQKQIQTDDDDSEQEPWVDHKNLKKKLNTFERHIDEKIDKKAEEKAKVMLDKQKQESWLKNNPDFYDVLHHAEKFAQYDPELAETILEMPNTFERQKLVYKNIKALGLHKPPEKQETIQHKIETNKRNLYYQPSGMGNAPYAAAGDFSSAGQKNAYAKMQELKARLHG